MFIMHYLIKLIRLKLSCFGQIMQRLSSEEKPLMLGKLEGTWRRTKDGWTEALLEHLKDQIENPIENLYKWWLGVENDMMVHNQSI